MTMDEKCNGIYCEAETDRYQIAKNSYNLLMPNDVFNSKTYTILVFIISIMILIYYYRMLVDFKNFKFNNNNDKNIIIYSIAITVLFLIILIIMIAARYAPNDEQGYINYFKNLKIVNYNGNGNLHSISIGFVVFIISIIIIATFYKLDSLEEEEAISPNEVFKFISNCIKLTCFFISITLVFNLMNIVMCFRTNTTPILKTKPLYISLNQIDPSEYLELVDKDNTGITKEELSNIISIITEECKGKKIPYAIDIYNAYEQLYILLKKSEENKLNGKIVAIDKEYVTKLKYTILKSYEKYNLDSLAYEKELSLIFDKKVSIPIDYGDHDPTLDPTLDPYFSSSHDVNSNDRNTKYEYTADISYGNANVFYEKYWDMRGNDETNFLNNSTYFVPNNLNAYMVGANLFRFVVSVAAFILLIMLIMLIYGVISYRSGAIDWESIYTIFELILPLIAFVVFVTYIIVFIRFNTSFNKNVVYKCLDCSYKRSLNKLNTIVSPYIRMYDNKITRGNKDYKHHYIIANVFYSILSGNINLSDNAFSPINGNVDDASYFFTISNELRANELKVNINNLSDENQFREYYKTRFINLYDTKYNDDVVKKIYALFTNLFVTTAVANTQPLIDSYFKTSIIKYDLILKIYTIIKICIKLFEEKTFNNSDIKDYKDFKFYKKNKLIPHKFILILKSTTEYNTFVSNYSSKYNIEFDDIIKDKLINTHDKNKPTSTDMTSILTDISNEDSTNQNENIQNKNVIKIIAKYLLIMGHINYNGFDYIAIKDKTPEDTKKKEDIYTLQTLKLYELISNVSYVDTFEIDDTFGKENKIITTGYEKYKTLTYMYNYLDTKYVIVSSNNNKNYLLNIIKSINNTLNNDNKTTPDKPDDIKEAKYFFNDRIKEIDPEKQYEDEDVILNKAHEISTISFESTYFVNMFIIVFYIIGTIFFKIK